MKKLVAVIAVIAAMLPAVAAAEQSAAERRAQERMRAQEAARAREAQRSRNEAAHQTERIERTLKLGGSGELDLTNLAGDIVITRGGGNEIRIEAIKTARGRNDQEAREMLSLVEVTFAERGNRGEAKVSYPRPGGFRDGRSVVIHRNVNVSVAFNVSAPENTEISVKTLSGNVRVTSIKGELSLTSMSGDVVVQDTPRITSAKSTSGNVEIVNTKSEVPLEATTISGDVILRQVSAPSVQLESVSGSVRMIDVETGRLEAQSVTGTIDMNGRLQKNGRYDLQSHAGNVQVMLTGNVGFEFDANTFNGSVQLDMNTGSKDLKIEPASRASARGGRQRSQRGVYGDGSALLDITTFSGNVVIGRR